MKASLLRAPVCDANNGVSCGDTNYAQYFTYDLILSLIHIFGNISSDTFKHSQYVNINFHAFKNTKYMGI